MDFMNWILSIYHHSNFEIFLVAVTAFFWGASHIFLVQELGQLNLISRIFGFLGLLSVFIVSGFTGGLLAVPCVLAASFFGAWEAGKLKGKMGK